MHLHRALVFWETEQHQLIRSIHRQLLLHLFITCIIIKIYAASKQSIPLATARRWFVERICYVCSRSCQKKYMAGLRTMAQRIPKCANANSTIVHVASTSRVFIEQKLLSAHTNMLFTSKNNEKRNKTDVHTQLMLRMPRAECVLHGIVYMASPRWLVLSKIKCLTKDSVLTNVWAFRADESCQRC